MVFGAYGQQSPQERHESSEHRCPSCGLKAGEFLYIELPAGVTRQMLLDEYQEMLQRARELGEMPPMSQ